MGKNNFGFKGVSKQLIFGKAGGYANWADPYFEFLGIDNATLARIKAGEAIDDNDVVVLSQLNDLIDGLSGDTDAKIAQLISVMPIIVSGVVTTSANLPVATGNEQKIYVVSEATGLSFYHVEGGAWAVFTPNEQQLVTFVVDATLQAANVLGDDGTTTSSSVFDSHIYTYESATVLKDIGDDTGIETKLALLQTTLETLIEESIAEATANVVKTKRLNFDHTGLTSANFDGEIPDGSVVSQIRVIMKTPMDAEFSTFEVVNNNVTLITADDIIMKKTEISTVDVDHEVAGEFTINAAGGSPTAGNGVIEVTYSMPSL